MHIDNRPVQGCIGCYKCKEKGICVFRDETYLTLRDRLAEADGIIIGSPVYFGGPSGSLCALLDRLFYSCGQLAQYPGVDASRVGVLGICGGGGYTLKAAQTDKRFKAVTTLSIFNSGWCAATVSSTLKPVTCSSGSPMPAQPVRRKPTARRRNTWAT